MSFKPSDAPRSYKKANRLTKQQAHGDQRERCGEEGAVQNEITVPAPAGHHDPQRRAAKVGTVELAQDLVGFRRQLLRLSIPVLRTDKQQYLFKVSASGLIDLDDRFVHTFYHTMSSTFDFGYIWRPHRFLIDGTARPKLVSTKIR